jgi:hypothetical protein
MIDDMMNVDFAVNVLLHMGLEGIGGVVTLWALQFCEHRRHQVTVWLIFALFFSILTVRLIG